MMDENLKTGLKIQYLFILEMKRSCVNLFTLSTRIYLYNNLHIYVQNIKENQRLHYLLFYSQTYSLPLCCIILERINKI